MEAGDTKDEIFANDPYYETLHKIIACFRQAEWYKLDKWILLLWFIP